MLASAWGRDLRCWVDPDLFRLFGPQARQAVAGFKLFLDGALALRTAALDEPYLRGGSGLLLHTDQQLHERLAGLVAGDRVVTVGQGGLKQGSRIKPVRL